jgi:hypothetical protein
VFRDLSELKDCLSYVTIFSGCSAGFWKMRQSKQSRSRLTRESMRSSRYTSAQRPAGPAPIHLQTTIFNIAEAQSLQRAKAGVTESTPCICRTKREVSQHQRRLWHTTYSEIPIPSEVETAGPLRISLVCGSLRLSKSRCGTAWTL